MVITVAANAQILSSTKFNIIYANTFRENRGFVFIIIVQFMMRSNSRILIGLQIVFVCL